MPRSRYFFHLLFVLTIFVAVRTEAKELNVGLSRVVITPQESLWLSGYAIRTEPAQGKVHDLWAKAAAFVCGDERLVLVTVDLGSVNPLMTERIATRVKSDFGLPRGSLIINCSHTHCAPEVAEERLVFHQLAAAEEEKIAKYIAKTEDDIVALIGRALADVKPAKVTVSRSEAGFAFNRRLPTGGPSDGVTDREVPVMKIASPEGELRGIVFGYACHNTTLAFQFYSGDYAGFAQDEIELRHPEVQAMFLMGCGGDQNPQPRHGAEGLNHARTHGASLADAVDLALKGEQTPVEGPMSLGFEVIELELEPLPPVADLRSNAALGEADVSARKARYLLEMIDRGADPPRVESCPLHVVRFGDELLMIFISGETVVDYSLRCKADFSGPFVWVAGYCDDVFAYLPSRRVLFEGGYEGRSAIIHNLTPTPFAPNVERQVMDCLTELVSQTKLPLGGGSPSVDAVK